MKKIILNPNIDIQYSAYYIVGLRLVFGRKNVKFADTSSIEKFNNIKSILCLTFLVIDDEKSQVTKIAIDHGDFNTINNIEIYNWSDIYGKINTNWNLTPSTDFPKIISLAPNFGIRCFNILESIFYSFKNFSIVKPKNIKRYFAQYIKQNCKLFINQYPISEGKKGYVFSVNTLWYSDEWNLLDEKTNKVRAEFIEICKSMPYLNFEGGFVPSGLGNNNFNHLHLKKRLSQKQYLNKLKESIFAFNTPAVWDCHGWKLGEYLCMGKAIISTPLSNDLPSEFINGETFHIVNNKNELISAIKLLNEDREYRKKLELNSLNYFKKYVAPESVIKLLGI